MDPRYRLNDPSTLLSPSLLIYRDIARQNLASMIAVAGGAERLRPHVKTHKMPALVEMCEAAGVHKHKVATIAEAEMVAAAGGEDVLLAYPLVGPNVGRMLRLVESFPCTTFRALVDDPDVARGLSEKFATAGRRLPVLVDVEVGMGRTGIAPDRAEALYEIVHSSPGLTADGLHGYDGHIHTPDPDQRRKDTAPGQAVILSLRDRLEARGMTVPRLVLGGTPTFPAHAALDAPGLELSPGTCLLHDVGYGSKMPDLPFTPAALLLTRVISRPRPGRITLDLGHKAVAADPPAAARLVLLGLPGAVLGKQNEEHLIVDTRDADRLPPGTPLLAVPGHVCPTCALHRRAYVIEGGDLVDEWEVAARDRTITV